MATDIERLVLQLSADVRGYQKALDRASRDTDRTARGIETRFNRMNRNINSSFSNLKTGIGSFGAGVIGGLVSAQTVRQIGQVIKSVADLKDSADKAGTSAEALQALSFVGKQAGVETDTLTTALAKLNKTVGEARTKGNDLKKIFDANNLTFSDDPAENFRKIAGLIKNARNEQDAAVIGAAAFGKAYVDLLPLLKQGEEALRAGEKAARDSGAVISNELVAAADEFDDRWTAAWTSFAGNAKSALLQTLTGLDFITKHPVFTTKAVIQGLTGIDTGLEEQKILETQGPAAAAAFRTQKELLNLTKQRIEIEKQIADLQINGGTQAAVDALRRQLDAVNLGIADAQKRLGARADKLSDLTEIKAPIELELADLERQKDALQQKLNETELAIQATVTGGVDTSSIDSSILVIENRIAELNKEIAVKVNIDTGESLAEVDRLKSELLAVQTRLTTLQQQRIDLIGAGSAQSGSLKEMEGQLKAIEDQAAAAKARLDELRQFDPGRTNTAAQEEAAQLEQTLIGFAEQREQIEKRIQAIKSATATSPQLTAYQQELDAVIAKIKELQAELAKVNGQFGAITSGPGPTFERTGRGGFPAQQSIVPIKPESGATDRLDKSIGKFEEVIDKFARDVSQAESGGRATAKNPLSTATGLGQFIESTWIDLFRKNFPDRAANLSREGILALRTNAQVSFDLIKAYARENANVLKAAGQSVTEANLQLSHFLGPKGAVDVLKAAPGTPVNQVLPQNVIQANQSVLGGGKTVDDVIRYAEARVRATEADKAGKQAFDELIASQQQGVGAAQLENQLFGDTSLAAEQLRVEFQLLAEAKRALGRELLPDEVAKIKETAGAMAEQTVRARELADAQEQTARSAEDMARANEEARQTMEAIGGAFKGALQGFINDLIQGKSLTDALRDSLINLGQSLLNIALDNLFKGFGSGLAGGSGGGGILGSLFHAGSTAAGSGGPSRRVSREAFIGAPRYHSGGIAGFKPGELPAILKRGEPIGPEAVDAAARKLIALGGSKLIPRNDNRSVTVNNQFVIPTERAAMQSQNQIAQKSADALGRARRVA